MLHKVDNGWDGYSEIQKERAASMNNIFCGLHNLVGLAYQSSQTLTAWAKMIFGEARVGAKKVGVSSKGNEGGQRDLSEQYARPYRTGVLKSQPVQFQAFLRERGRNFVPLTPFKGNRFNSLFHNGAATFYLAINLKEFFNNYKDDNLLMRAVHITWYHVGLLVSLTSSLLNPLGKFLWLSLHSW